MDSFSIPSVLKIIQDFGLVGLIIFLWWYDNRRIWAVIARYKTDMDEQREMYKTNASLCQDFASIARDLRAIVTLNIQKMTAVEDAVKGNQFCPLIRVTSQKTQPIAEIKSPSS